ncbi:MAG: ABC transporter permease [Candidatus Rokubacteria bacterium]|nr:ABC transporter permease [Candidatus Rokubacteria bacterium]
MVGARLSGIILKEFLQLRRDPMALTLALFFPVVLLFIFGYAINTDVRHLPTVVFDQSRDVEAQTLLEAFVNTQYFDLKYYARSHTEVTRLIDMGRAKVGIVIPPDFASRLRGRGGAAVQLIVDASDPQVAGSAVNAATALELSRSIQVLSEAAGASQREPVGLDVRIRAWYNPDQESALFIVPGLIAALLMQTTITIMAVAVVRERERGTLEALIVSPLRRWEVMLGKIIPNLLVAYGQMTLALIVAHSVFAVPIRGSLGLLYGLSALFMMGTLGIGIYLSTIARTIPQAMQLGMLAILPSIYLSGLLFPIEGMPEAAQYLALILPITYFLRIVRGIVLKGIGLAELWPDVWPLVVFGVVIFSLAVVRFRKSLD